MTLCAHAKTQSTRTLVGATGHSIARTVLSKSSTAILIGQIDPRRTTPADSGGNTGPAGTRDDGFGQCPAFTHKHSTQAQIDKECLIGGVQTCRVIDPAATDHIEFDGKCHDDQTDAPILERRRLPKPAFHPDPDLNWL